MPNNLLRNIIKVASCRAHVQKSFFPIFWLNIYLQETDFRSFFLKHAAPRDA